MAVVQHPEFNPPSPPDSLLWRYLSLPKFLALLQTRCIYFSNLEMLARADPFEGTLPPSRLEHRKWNTPEDVPDDLRPQLRNYLRRGETGDLLGLQRMKEARELRVRQAYAYRRSYFVNCWHVNQHESAAMWALYSRTDEGIALVSSPTRIAASLQSTPQEVFGGCVQYGDYESRSFTIDDGNAFRPVLYKRQSFAHEAEYRLVVWDTDITHKTIHPFHGVYNLGKQSVIAPPGSGAVSVGRSESEIESIDPVAGKPIPCDLSALVERVVVSPLAQRWFADVVAQACDAWGLDTVVQRSRLAEDPLR